MVEPTAQVSATVPTELRDRVTHEAETRGVSVSFLVTKALREKLPEWEADAFVHPDAELNQVPDSAYLRGTDDEATSG